MSSILKEKMEKEKELVFLKQQNKLSIERHK
jgi:hypothetical protein